MRYRISKIEDWQAVSVEISAKLKYKILLLKGALGAGKTTFTQFLLKNLQSKDHVSSPTYTIVNEYVTKEGKVFHFDLYRMKNLEEVYDIGIDEYLESGSLCIIEWPEIFEHELADFNFHTLKIENFGSERLVNFE